MILGFKTKFSNGNATLFPEKILSGVKIHTIRLDPKMRWQPGKEIHFATGVRTANYKQFATGVVKRMETITIQTAVSDWSKHGVCNADEVYKFKDRWVKIAIEYKKHLTVEEMKQLAKNDGFDSLDEMLEWFFPGTLKGGWFPSFCGSIIYFDQVKSV